MSISDQIYQNLKQDIVTCALPPGESFSEAELAKRYRASRTPIRAACRQLKSEGLMKIIPYRGYFIAPLTVAEFHNLQEVQLIVDPAAAALAAQRANASQVEAMMAAAKYEYKVGVKASYYEFLQRNYELHVGIAQATDNKDLLGIVTNIHTRLMRYFYLGLSLDAFGPELVAEHCNIVDAIKARNPEEARQRAAEHVSNTIRRSANLFLAATGTRLEETVLGSDHLRRSFQSVVEWEDPIEQESH